MSPANRALNIAEEMARAGDALRAAGALVDLALFRDGMSRLYYAVFHATCAVLLTEEREPTTHRGVLSVFSLEFVKPGRLPTEMATTFKRIQGYREASDYTRGFEIPETTAREELAAARGYLETVRTFLTGAGYGST